MMPNRTPNSVWYNPVHFISFGFGSGAMPYASGTFGTLAAMPFYSLLAHLSIGWYALITLLFIVVASWLADKTCKEINVHDHPGIVIDEFAGFFVTMFALPVNWLWIILGFISFRFFDIWKPWPIRIIDKKLINGFGVVFDDVVAGCYAAILLSFIKLISIH